MIDTNRPDTRWRFSAHAIHRMRAMGVEADEVLAAVDHPELTYRGSHAYPDGRHVATSGRVAVVFAPADEVIITVLWHLAEGRYPILTPAAP